jgi:hypothetical protein
MKKVLATAVIAAAAALVPGAAMASPNYLGPTGYILTPNAKVVPNMCVELGYHWLDSSNQGRFVPNVSQIHSFKGNMGFGNFLEIGGSHWRFPSIAGFNTTQLNAKAAIGESWPVQIAGGVLDALDDTQRGAYVAGGINVGKKLGSNLLPKSLEVGAGWGTGNIVNGIFANGGFMLGPNLQLMAEWIERTGFGNRRVTTQFGMVNTGARLHFKKLSGVAIDLGVLDVTRDPTPSAGLSYSLCFGKKHKKHVGDDEDEGGKGEEKPAGEPKPVSKSAPKYGIQAVSGKLVSDAR